MQGCRRHMKWKSALKAASQSWSLHLPPKGRGLGEHDLIPLPTLQISRYSKLQLRSAHIVVEQNHAHCLNPLNHLKILVFRINRGVLPILRQSP